MKKPSHTSLMRGHHRTFEVVEVNDNDNRFKDTSLLEFSSMSGNLVNTYIPVVLVLEVEDGFKY